MTTAVAYPPQGWVPMPETFGDRLHYVRWRMGWTVKEAALRTNLPENSWHNWEAGRVPRKIADVVDAVVAVTGCDYYWLLRGGDWLPHLDSNQEPSDSWSPPLRKEPVAVTPAA